jgi:hypothetical protein
MQGLIRFISYDPAVVARGNVEEIAGIHLDNPAIRHRCDGLPCDDHANVFDIAVDESYGSSYISRPLPPWSVYGAADHHATEANQVESSFWEGPYFVRLVEALQDHVMHAAIPLTAETTCKGKTRLV